MQLGYSTCHFCSDQLTRLSSETQTQATQSSLLRHLQACLAAGNTGLTPHQHARSTVKLFAHHRCSLQPTLHHAHCPQSMILTLSSCCLSTGQAALTPAGKAAVSTVAAVVGAGCFVALGVLLARIAYVHRRVKAMTVHPATQAAPVLARRSLPAPSSGAAPGWLSLAASTSSYVSTTACQHCRTCDNEATFNISATAVQVAHTQPPEQAVACASVA